MSKVLLKIFILLLSVSVLQAKKQEKSRKIPVLRAVRCKSDNYTIKVNKCFIKAISKRDVSLSLSLDISKLGNKKILFEITVNFRVNNVYRKMMSTNRLDWCVIMEGTSNPIIQAMLREMGDSAKVLHKCPYDGKFELLDFLPSNAESTFLPEGMYRYDLNVYLEDTEIIDFKLFVKVFPFSEEISR
jgi:Protein of unknown function (DUF1091)